MPQKANFLIEHLRHAVLPIPLVAFFLSVLYSFGFVDIPASRSEVTNLKERVTKLETDQDHVGEQLKDIREQNSRDGQKLDDVKQNVDRLVSNLIDGAMDRHQPASNFRKQ